MPTVLWTAYLFVQIGSLGVAGGHGGIVPQEQVMHGGTNYFTSPNHHGVSSSNLHPWKRSQHASEMEKQLPSFTRHQDGNQHRCTEADSLHRAEILLRTRPWQSALSAPATAWILYTGLPAAGFGDLFRPRSAH